MNDWKCCKGLQSSPRVAKLWEPVASSNLKKRNILDELMKFDLATILVYDLRVCSTIYVGAINEEAQVSGAAGKRTSSKYCRQA